MSVERIKEKDWELLLQDKASYILCPMKGPGHDDPAYCTASAKVAFVNALLRGEPKAQEAARKLCEKG